MWRRGPHSFRRTGSLITRTQVLRRTDHPASLPAELSRKLAAEIESGRLPPGARLPTEQELVAATGVSRSVVREAVAALRAAGLVTPRQGVGVFVTARVAKQPFHVDPHEVAGRAELIDITEVRAAIEVNSAGLAALRRRAADLRAIEAALAGLAAHTDLPSAVAADLAFHHAVAAATRNPHFGRVLRSMGEIMEPEWSMTPGRARAGFAASVLRDHAEILDAIRQRDADAARAAMERHLSTMRRQARRRELRPD